MRSHPVIAKYTAPKQRMTRHYGFVIVHNTASDKYSVHRFYIEDGGMSDSVYDLTAEEAWKEFHERIARNSEYGPGTWE